MKCIITYIFFQTR